MKVLLLGHRKNVGKDTIADIICAEAEKRLGPMRSVKVGFADPIKAQAYQMFKRYGLMPGAFYDEPCNAHLKEVPLPGLNLSPRQIYISLGTWGRSINERLWSDLTADYCQQALRANKVAVVKDLRYKTEPKSFLALELPILRVCVVSNRAGGLDEPDSALLDYKEWDYVFFNDCPRDQLEAKVLDEIWPRLEIGDL